MSAGVNVKKDADLGGETAGKKDLGGEGVGSRQGSLGRVKRDNLGEIDRDGKDGVDHDRKKANS